MTGKLYSGAKVAIQAAVSSTANGEAVDCSGFSSLVVEISGTFVATVTFQARISDGAWTAIQAANMNDGTVGTTATGTGLFYVPCAGLSEFRAPVTWASGTSVTVEAQPSVAGGGISLADVDIQSTENVHVLSIAAGDNNIGNVDIASEIPAGTQNIGGVEFVDENGTLYGVKHVDNKPRVSSMSYFVDIAEGNVPNHTAVNKFGHNSDVPGTYEDVWDQSANYEYLADDTFASMYISSDNAGDQGVTYQVEGLDSDYNFSSVQVTTDGSDGTTFVALTSGAADNKWWRVYRAWNTSGSAALGNIYISKDNTDLGGNGIPDTLTDIQAKILIGFEQTLMALWSVPVDNTAYITSYYASTSSNKATEVILFIRPFGGVFNVKHFITINQGHINHMFDFPIPIAAKSDIKVTALAGGAGGEVSAGFDLWYET